MAEKRHRDRVGIRRGRPAEAKRIRAITHASKAHWGYDRGLVADWAAGLDFTPPSFERREIFVAEIDGQLVAWAGLIPKGELCILDDLWVDPPWFGRGIGSQLFARCVARARELGAARLEWGAEPNSVGFYEKMGGRWLRDHTSVWGRQTPWMGLDLDDPIEGTKTSATQLERAAHKVVRKPANDARRSRAPSDSMVRASKSI